MFVKLRGRCTTMRNSGVRRVIVYGGALLGLVLGVVALTVLLIYVFYPSLFLALGYAAAIFVALILGDLGGM
jgi:hypothetical protein